MDPLEGLEERIVRAVMVALKGVQGSVQSGAPPLPMEVPPDTPRPPSSSSSKSREVESNSTSILRGSSHKRVDVLGDLKRYPFKPRFGGRNCKPEEVNSFISILEDFFNSSYQDDDKIKATVICLQDKARV